MNYYERHIGDYARDTGYLSVLEHGIYCLLLDRYYATEQPIPANKAHRIARAHSKKEKSAVDVVLDEFFLLQEDGWHNKRCDEEIARFHARAAAQQENGKKGGRPRNSAHHDSQTQTQQKPADFDLDNPNETQSKANTNPNETQIEPNQKPTRPQTPLSLPHCVRKRVWYSPRTATPPAARKNPSARLTAHACPMTGHPVRLMCCTPPSRVWMDATKPRNSAITGTAWPEPRGANRIGRPPGVTGFAALPKTKPAP